MPVGRGLDPAYPSPVMRRLRAIGRVWIFRGLQTAISRFDHVAARDAKDNEHLAVILAAILSEDSNCIDIGANVGGVLAEVVRVAPRGRHLAFEPVPSLAAGLRSRFPEVDVREVALTDYNGEAQFKEVVSFPALSGLHDRELGPDQHFRTITVRTARLDDELPEDYAPSFIKIDVEGAELQVLRGAAATLRRHKPLVVFEHGIGVADHVGTRPEDVHRLLTEYGMRIFDIDGAGPYSEADFIQAFPEPIWTFIAGP